MATQKQRILDKAQQLLTAAIQAHHEALRVQWERRDVTPHAALTVRDELFALQGVEHKLTRLIDEAHNG